MPKHRRIIRLLAALPFILLALAVIVPVFVTDRFTVKGHSMAPTLHSGQHIFVNKLLMGARIYKSYDFDTPRLSCFRMPGLRGLRPGDVAVFNYPEGWEDGKIGFKINYVYAKRCIGVAGDTVSIINGCYRNSSRPSDPICPEEGQKHLRITPDSLLREEGVALPALSYGETGWTIKDFGPLYVPRKGDVVSLDSLTVAKYRKIIEYETGQAATVGGKHRFTQDYCFFGGDNVLNSRDSRYIGLVPEDFVIGIVSGID